MERLTKMIPKRLSSFQPLRWTVARKKATDESRDSVEYARPVSVTD